MFLLLYLTIIIIISVKFSSSDKLKTTVRKTKLVTNMIIYNMFSQPYPLPSVLMRNKKK